MGLPSGCAARRKARAQRVAAATETPNAAEAMKRALDAGGRRAASPPLLLLLAALSAAGLFARSHLAAPPAPARPPPAAAAAGRAGARAPPAPRPANALDAAVPMLADGDGPAAVDAVNHLVWLATPEADTPGAAPEAVEMQMAQRRAALETALGGSVEVRYRWRSRLAAARPRGIVVCAGGDRALANAFAALHVLRRALNCSLPVAVMHWGEGEARPGTRAFWRRNVPNVEFVDMSLLDYPRWHRSLRPDAAAAAPDHWGYRLKAFALYAAPFRDVFMIDADATPLRSPAPLFELPVFKAAGNLFWPDFWVARPGIWDFLGGRASDPWAPGAPLAWDPARDGGGGGGEGDNSDAADVALGADGVRTTTISLAAPPARAAPPTPTRQAESGAILLNRARHWRALEYALLLNTHEEVVYRLPGVLGDKDTWRAAFALAGAGAAFRQAPHAPAIPVVDRRGALARAAPAVEGAPPADFEFAGMVQLSPDGAPLLHHRTAWAKFPACPDPAAPPAAPTHVSPPAADAQAAALTAWRPGWALDAAGAREVSCGGKRGGRRALRAERCTACSLEALADVDDVCFGRSAAAREAVPAPITLVRIPPTSRVGRALAAAEAAHAMIPCRAPAPVVAFAVAQQ